MKQQFLFLNQVAFIGNIAFIVTMIMHYSGPIFQNKDLESYWLVAGHAVIILNIYLLLNLIFKRSFIQLAPKWLIGFNGSLLLLEAIYFLSL
ncbi:hypothetical protein [Hydrotalea sp.]|uniref:hypothetical protein n=1 Tax=Hydrotalea sp. TaxID=2881279 RepID=UPI003D0CD9E1